MNLKSESVGGRRSPFSSASLIFDEDIIDSKMGKVVALVLYSEGGNVIYWHKEGYDPRKVMVAGEKYLFETLRASRFKEYKVTPK